MVSHNGSGRQYPAYRGLHNYEMMEELGRGTHGSVRKARHRLTNEIVAIKFVERGPERVHRHVRQELLAHRILIHHHVIRFKEAFLYDVYLCIVMELAAGGSLFDHIERSWAARGQGLSEPEVRWFFWQLVVATDFCHRKNFCNRDIKLENALVTDQSQLPLLKLCDFGFAKALQSEEGSLPTTTVGTLHYMAPEVISARGRRNYSGEAADIWSCGVVLYVMLYWHFPFSKPGDDKLSAAEQQKLLIERIRQGDYKLLPVYNAGKDAYGNPVLKPVSVAMRDLITAMLTLDPSQRITMAGIFQHPWFLQNIPDGVLTMNDNCQNRQPPADTQTEEELLAILDAAASRAGSSSQEQEEEHIVNEELARWERGGIHAHA